jgi:hypothetical protein
MIALTDSSIKGIYVFSYDFQDSTGDFWKRVDELNNDASIVSENRNQAKQYIKEFRENFKQPVYFENFISHQQNKKSIIQTIRCELYPYKEVLRWYLKKESSRKNFLPSTGISVDYRPPRIILRDYYAHKRNENFIDNYKYFPYKNLGKYIYFPLQYQPESTIDVVAPFFSNQIETARLLGMSMPDEYTLAVKEHPAMRGLRPPSYIKKLDRTVNVKLIDYRTSSEQMIKGADMIISTNSTTLSQAAFLGKPAIQLGNLGTTLKLPNVIKHTDMTTMSGKIKELLRKELKGPEYERRLENFVTAAYDVGFKIDYRSEWDKGKGRLTENIWEIYKKEIDKNFVSCPGDVNLG